MTRGTSGFLALVVSIPLLYFPGRTAWSAMTETTPNPVDTIEEFMVLSNKYETATCKEQTNMVCHLDDEQKAYLQALHSRAQMQQHKAKQLKLKNHD